MWIGENMNYIILDLEWNQSPLGKLRKDKELPFEIIEIGAVKLDVSKEVKSEFSEVIKPQVYEEIHYKTKEIINIQMKDLQDGGNFLDVITRFFDWCGKDYIFCTWGSMDLTELQRNMKYFNITGRIDQPIRYYDIQEIFSFINKEDNVTRALEYAVDKLNIKKDYSFHRALYDAKYAANILQLMDTQMWVNNYSIDYYHNPKSKEEKIRVVCDSYLKEVSMEFNEKEDALSDKEVRSTKCYKCGKKTTKKIKWFSHNAKTYYCLVVCKEHGNLIGNIGIKKTTKGKFFIVKTVRQASKEDTNNLRIKYMDIHKKKKINKLIGKD